MSEYTGSVTLQAGDEPRYEVPAVFPAVEKISHHGVALEVMLIWCGEVLELCSFLEGEEVYLITRGSVLVWRNTLQLFTGSSTNVRYQVSVR